MIFLWINSGQFLSAYLFVLCILYHWGLGCCRAKQLEDIITSFMKLWIFLTSLIVKIIKKIKTIIG